MGKCRVTKDFTRRRDPSLFFEEEQVTQISPNIIFLQAKMHIQRRLAPMAFPATKTLVPLVLLKHKVLPYVEFFSIHAFPFLRVEAHKVKA